MGMFDWYRPTANIKCPECQTELREWQGKDGPCAAFVWKQGVAAPVDQLAGDECNLATADRLQVRLPETFEIYSYDCPEHGEVTALGTCADGVWVETKEVRRGTRRNQNKPDAQG